MNTAEKDGLDARLTGVRQVNGSATLLYDAKCGLCRGCVRWLEKRDRHGRRPLREPGRLRFEPLQSELGQSHLRRLGLPTKDFDSMIFVRALGQRGELEYLLRTDALVAALKLCGGLARVVGTLLGLIPRPLRDAAYKTVARFRHRAFGR